MGNQHEDPPPEMFLVDQCLMEGSVLDRLKPFGGGDQDVPLGPSTCLGGQRNLHRPPVQGQQGFFPEVQRLVGYGNDSFPVLSLAIYWRFPAFGRVLLSETAP